MDSVAGRTIFNDSSMRPARIQHLHDDIPVLLAAKQITHIGEEVAHGAQSRSVTPQTWRSSLMGLEQGHARGMQVGAVRGLAGSWTGSGGCCW